MYNVGKEKRKGNDRNENTYFVAVDSGANVQVIYVFLFCGSQYYDVECRVLR